MTISTDCSTPEYHETHKYCPSCSWREETLEERMMRSAEWPLAYTTNMGADAPLFHRIRETEDGNIFPLCDPKHDRNIFWSCIHIKHAARIGKACDWCFPLYSKEK